MIGLLNGDEALWQDMAAAERDYGTDRSPPIVESVRRLPARTGKVPREARNLVATPAVIAPLPGHRGEGVNS